MIRSNMGGTTRWETTLVHPRGEDQSTIGHEQEATWMGRVACQNGVDPRDNSWRKFGQMQ